MIPILYEKNEVSFTTNGIGRLRDCISCVVTEERNGIYECDFEYPITGAHYEDIQVGCIICVSHSTKTTKKATRFFGVITDEDRDLLTDENGQRLTASKLDYVTDDDLQPFDIVSYSKPINGIVTFHCVHISYRLNYVSTLAVLPANTIEDAFELCETGIPSNPFVFQTDKTSTGYVAATGDGLPHTVRQILGGIQGSILDTYGGEYEWDKWVVYLHSARGETRDFAIRYGVNMLDYNEEYDIQGTYSSCLPYWTDGAVTVLRPKVSADGTTITGRGECVPLDLSDKFETQPTQNELAQAAQAFMNNNKTFLPIQNIHIEFARLQDLGFENLDNLLECNLCDTINVIFPDFNSSRQFKIVKTVWNVLQDRYQSMELGDLSITLAEALGVSSEHGN